MADNGSTERETEKRSHGYTSQSSHFKVSPKPPWEQNKEPGGGENWGAGFQSDCAWNWQPLRKAEKKGGGWLLVLPLSWLIPGYQAEQGGRGEQAAMPASTFLLYPDLVATEESSHRATAHSLGLSWGHMYQHLPSLTVK